MTVKNGFVFPLERYLEKVVAIHAHCAVLTKFAHSPRLRSHFHNKSFEVRSVPPIITIVPLPSDLGERIEDILAGHDLERDDNDLLEKIISATKKKFFRNGGPVQAHVHCECALVHYFNDPTVPSDQCTLRWLTWASVSYRAMRVRSLLRRQTSTVTGSFTPEDVMANGISLGPHPSLTSKFRARSETP